MSTISRTKTLYTLQDPTWIKNSGTDKGINHDRQHLGLILAAGQVLTIKQTNPKFKGSLTLWLLNSDNQTEKSFSITSTAANISFTTTSVPFITTPYSTIAPVIEYSFPNTSKPLPVYNECDDELPFFQLWDSHDAEFALIYSQFIQILVPKVDKEKMRNTGITGNLNGVIGNYNQIFEFYNSLLGVSFDSDVATDKNIPNRYFGKADLHGWGAAYYGSDWTAQTSSSIASFWLAKIEDNWGCLHEIAHGYEGKFMSDPVISTSEVWNNIFAATFQYKILGDQVYKKGWLYNYGKESAVLAQIQNNLKDNVPVNSWDLRSKLFFLMQLKDSASDAAFTHFYQNYRVISNQTGFAVADYQLLELLSDSYIEIAGVDVTPYVYRAGATMRDTQREINLFSESKPVYPLTELVSESQATALKTSLNLHNTLSLVTGAQLASTSLKSDLTITLNIDDAAQISGEKVLITQDDVSHPLKTIEISGTTLTLSQLPVGVYKIQLPTGKSTKYKIDDYYAVVKEGGNTQTINYVEKLSSPLINQSFNFLGLGDDFFCSLKVDHSTHKIIVDVTNSAPHSYFPGTAYAKIEIYDVQGNIVFNRTMNGDKTSISHDEIPFETSYRIAIFHQETSTRLKLAPAAAGVINTKSTSNTFVITSAGLVNEALQNDPFIPLLTAISNQADKIRAIPSMLAAEYASSKDDIYTAISLFASPQKEQLLETYQDVISTHNSLHADPDVLTDGFTLNLQARPDGEQFSYEATLKTSGCEAVVSKTLYPADNVSPSLQITIADQNGKALFKYVHKNG